jgi:hypothetical protein
MLLQNQSEKFGSLIPKFILLKICFLHVIIINFPPYRVFLVLFRADYGAIFWATDQYFFSKYFFWINFFQKLRENWSKIPRLGNSLTGPKNNQK